MNNSFYKKFKQICLQISACILVLLCSSVVIAQEANLSFRNLSISDGLSFSTASSFMQDAQGRMWIGTVDGLNLYDGSKFKVYRHSDKDSNSIINNQINAIVEAPNGQLWIATTSGISIYQPQQDHFININTLLKGRERVLTNVSGIAFEGKNIAWIGSSFGIIRLDLKSMQLQEFNSKDLNVHSTFVFLDRHNNIWVGVESYGVLLFNKEKKQFIEFKEEGKQNSKRQTNCARAICEDKIGNIWIGTDRGLEKYNIKNKTFTTHYYNPKKLNGPLKGMVRSIFEDNRNRIWVGFQYGLSIFDREKDEFIPIKHQPTNAKSICGDEVWSIYQDRNGSVWFGILISGVSIFDYNQAQFESYQNDPENPNSLIGNSVISLCEDKNGNVWIGADHAGLDCFNPKTNIFTHYRNDPFNKNSLSSDAVLSIDIDHEGIIWMGTWGGGLNRFNPQTKTFKHYLPNKNDPNSINGIHIWKALEDKHHNLLIATQAEGLGYYIRQKDQFVTYVNKPDDSTTIASNSINCILRDKQENIWLGTASGISKLENDKFKFKTYLSGRYIIDLYNDNKGTLWIATNCLIAMNLKTGKIESYYSDEGLESKMFSGIVEDDHNNLWVSTANGGIIKINIYTRKIKKYTLADGLNSLIFNRHARIKLSNGKLLFGTTNGITSFFPDSIKDNYITPPVIFTDFLVFNKSVKPGEKGSPLKKHISLTDTIALDYDQSVFSIYFSALNYIAPGRNNYAYILEGFEDKWNYVGSKNDATYTNLDPGEYKFKVKVSVVQGKWNTKETALTLIILPPFYLAWWFRLLIFILIIIILFSIYYMRVAQIRRSNIILKNLVEERTSELGHKNEILHSQTASLNETNALLEERQMQIEEQTEELISQKEELEVQAEKAVSHAHELEEAYKELSKYRNHLEALVEERTADLKSAKEKAEQSDKLKTAFLANMSHEIRTPLNAIIGFTNILAEEELSVEEKKSFSEIVERNSRYLISLVNDIIDLSKIESGLIKVEKKKTTLDFILHDVEMIYNEELKKIIQPNSNIKFVTNIDIQLYSTEVNTDALRLKQVIINLINNAIKFTKQGSVEFGCSHKGNSILFYVKDTGIGIKKEDFDLIFERFRKIEDQTDLYRGAGLGLSIAKQIVELLGGEIWVESEVGEGTVFSVVIPI